MVPMASNSKVTVTLDGPTLLISRRVLDLDNDELPAESPNGHSHAGRGSK